METRKMQIYGVVQGVGFRWAVQMQAQEMGLPGTVRNNPDGSVTIVVQGEPSELDAFTKDLGKAARFAHISRIDTEIVPEMEQLHSFHVLY